MPTDTCPPYSKASVGGMASTVARVTSVGMRAVLLTSKEMAPSEAAREVVANMWHWRNMDCDAMFPKCGSGGGGEGQTEVVEKEESAKA